MTNLCECGCGKPTPLYKQNNKARGQIKGQHMKVCPWHRKGLKGPNHPNWLGGLRLTGSGYIEVLQREHPRAGSSGYVRSHLLLAERALGKPVVPPMQVHHVNFCRDDNRPGNIVLCQDQAYHRLLHTRTKAIHATGNPQARQCKFCKEWGTDLQEMNKYGRTPYHKHCRNESLRNRRLSKEAPHGIPLFPL